MGCRSFALLFLLVAGSACSKAGEPVHSAETPAPKAAPEPAPEPAPERLALIIAIDDYVSGQVDGPTGTDSWWDLRGAVNDSRLVEQLLRQRFEFNDDEILVLRNEQASHAGILREFDRWLIQRAGPDTQVVIWYSGHGSRVPDLSGAVGEEAEQKDSSIVPWDARGARGDAPDISDDEIHSLLRALSARTPWITVVLDCCHAGGLTRSAHHKHGRWLPDDDQPVTVESLRGLWPTHLPFFDDDQRLLYPPLPVVTVSACGWDEEAEEYVPVQAEGQEATFGALTWFLTETLSEVPPGVTWEQLLEETALRVASRCSQQVQGTGPLDRQVFGGSFGPPLPGFRGTLSEGEIAVGAGGVHGLAPGQQLQVLDLARRPIGRAEVLKDDFGAYECFASLIPDDQRVLPQDSSHRGVGADQAVRVVPGSGGGSEAVVRLAVEDSAVGHALHQALQRLSPDGVQLVDTMDGADLWFLPGPNAAWQLVEAQNGHILWQEAAPPPSEADGRSAALAQYLSWEARYRRMLDLSDGFGGVPLTLKVRPASEERIAALRRARPDREYRSAPIDGQRPPLAHDQAGSMRDMVEFDIRLDESFPYPVHIALICVSEDRSVHTAWPTDPKSRENLLEPGQTLTRPIEVYFNESLDPKFSIRDRWLAVGTVSYADFSAFRGQTPTFIGPQANLTRSNRDALPGVLSSALEMRRTRSSSSLDEEDWTFGIAALDLMLKVEDSP